MTIEDINHILGYKIRKILWKYSFAPNKQEKNF